MSTWKIDPAHTTVTFAVRHMMVSTVRGTFSDVSGALELDPENPAGAYVEAFIGTASINTGVGDRDNHLRSGDFFDADKHPQMIFRSTGVELTGERVAKVHGELTIRGVTHPVVLDVEFLGEHDSNYGDHRAGFTASTRIDREQWGLTWNQALEAGGVLVGKDVRIELDVQFIRVEELVQA